MSDLAVRQMAQYKRKGWTETVVYHPHGAKARPIDALVNRIAAMEIMNSTVPVFHINVMNDQIHGIAPKLMDRGVDQIEVAERHGGPLQTRQIHQISEQDEEWITLVVI